MAGDLTIYGVRDNVKLIREDKNGHKQFVTLNLNDADLLLSPYYQLQQNDILYVTPNKTKAQSADIGTSTTKNQRDAQLFLHKNILIFRRFLIPPTGSV